MRWKVNRCSGLLLHVAYCVARLLRPQADLLEIDLGRVLIVSTAHVLTALPLFVLPKDVAPMAFRITAGVTFCGPTPFLPEVVRCHRHTRETLAETYALRTDAETLRRVLPEGYLMFVMDAPTLLATLQFEDINQEQALRDFFLRYYDTQHEETVRQHSFMAARATEHRFGGFPYPGCIELCPPSQCPFKHKMDLAWTLSPLWESDQPVSVTIANIGCRDLGIGDPIATLLGAANISLTGLCVDKDGSMLARARERLRGHRVQTVEADVDPHSVKPLLRSFFPESKVGILQVDIDCFDVSVLQAALVEIQADVVILEIMYGVPPPFRFAAHYSDHFNIEAHYADGKYTKLPYYGASLSYLVEFMAVRGYWLYKIDHMDGIWINKRLASRFEAAVPDLRFPVDEWSCFFDIYSTEGFRFDADWFSYMQEWLWHKDPFEALGLIWSNLTAVSNSVRLPFTLDMAGGPT